MSADTLINPCKYYHNLPIHVKYIIFEGKDGMVEGKRLEGWKDGKERLEVWKGERWMEGRC